VASILITGSPSCAPGQPSGPPVQEKVALDNESAYVTQLTFPPGAASGPHSSLDPELGIVVDGELTLVTPTGREILGPGTARWLPSLTVHDARNEGTRPVRMWVIIFKK
jgi:quercetin dioxygenase-like cupin family protein